MRLKLQRPLAVLDIESTGANWRVDRIIDLAVIRILPDGGREKKVFRVNPGMPIPPAATAIHGIRDEDVLGAPSFAEMAPAIAATLSGCDFAGYNLAKFDLPLLAEEFRRIGKTFDWPSCRVIDAQRIFHRREPRDLSAALAFYCGDEHAGAHGAEADAEATFRVIEGQMERYPDLPADVEGLALYCFPPHPDFIDREGKLTWDAGGEAALNFGVNRGRRLREIAVKDPSYLSWMLRKQFGPEVEQMVVLARENRLPRREQWEKDRAG